MTGQTTRNFPGPLQFRGRGGGRPPTRVGGGVRTAPLRASFPFIPARNFSWRCFLPPQASWSTSCWMVPETPTRLLLSRFFAPASQHMPYFQQQSGRMGFILSFLLLFSTEKALCRERKGWISMMVHLLCGQFQRPCLNTPSNPFVAAMANNTDRKWNLDSISYLKRMDWKEVWIIHMQAGV